MLWLILQQLKSGDPEKRRQAVERLAEHESPRALESVAKATGDSDPQVRVAAVNALATFDDDRALEPLLRAYRDPKSEVRLAVISRLKDTGRERVINVLVSALRDTDAVVRARAARLLEHSSWHAQEIEDEVWLAIGLGKLSRAAALGAAAIRPLESILHDPSAGGMHIAAIEALGSIPDERVMKSLVRALRSTDQTVCLAAIGALANAGGTNVENDLAPLLKHKDNRIRAAVIEVLARFDSPARAEDFRNLLRDPMWDVRCAAATALARSADLATIDALVGALKDQYEDVRSSAANSLGRIKDARAIGPLVLALKDPGTIVRKTAAGALAQIDPKWAETEAARKLAPDLRSSLASSDWFVRNAAASALKLIGEDSCHSSPQTISSTVAPKWPLQRAADNKSWWARLSPCCRTLTAIYVWLPPCLSANCVTVRRVPR